MWVDGIQESFRTVMTENVVAIDRVAIEWLPRPHKNTPTEFYMKKKPQKAQNIAV